MEILRDASSKRTVAAALVDSEGGRQFREALAVVYDVVSCKDADDCLRVMRERPFYLSAVIIDVDMARANDYAFLRTVSSDSMLATVPVIVVASRDMNEADMECLNVGALDVLVPPYYPLVIWRRIENAIRIVRSTTFAEIEKMLCELPSMIFAKDADGRYVFSTQAQGERFKINDPDWTIRGKTDLDIREDRENALKAMEADREIIRTGKGTSYVIEFTDELGKQKFMQLIKQPLFDDEGNTTGIIALGNDVTENERLKRELRKSALTDGLTGLGNHRAFEEHMDAVRAGNEFPMAIISADCDNLKKVNDTYGHAIGDKYICLASGILKDMMPEGCTLFRTGGDEFIAFLPRTTEAQALDIVEAMRARDSEFEEIDENVGMSYGVSEANAPEEVLPALIEADHLMYADKTFRRRGRA